MPVSLCCNPIRAITGLLMQPLMFRAADAARRRGATRCPTCGCWVCAGTVHGLPVRLPVVLDQAHGGAYPTIPRASRPSAQRRIHEPFINGTRSLPTPLVLHLRRT